MARMDPREGVPQPWRAVLGEGSARDAEVVDVPLPRVLRLVQEDDFRREERHAVRRAHPCENEGPRDLRKVAEAPGLALPLVQEDLELEGGVRGAGGGLVVRGGGPL